MKWTFNKPTKPGYYFYRDGMTDHDVIPIDYILDWEGLYYWNEYSKSWIPVEDSPDDVGWSSDAIEFPEEIK